MIPSCRKSIVQSSFKRSLKKTKLKRSKTDYLVWLNYILFMKVLAAECELLAVSEKSKVITSEHLRAVRKTVFRKLKG